MKKSIWLFPLLLLGTAAPPLVSTLSVTGQDEEVILDEQTTVSPEAGTYFGVHGTESVEQRSFTLSYAGTESTTLTDAIQLGGRDAEWFSIINPPTGSEEGDFERSFTIKYAPQTGGFHLADVVISLGGDIFTFRIGGIGDPDYEGCPDCFGVDKDDPNVCSGNGTCNGADTCICDPLFVGSNCQTPVQWSDGSTVAKAAYEFTPRIFVGPTVSDPAAVYRIKLRIDTLNMFQSSQGAQFGLFQSPPQNLNHNLGSYTYEYSYESTTGRTQSWSEFHLYGVTWTQGDTIMMEYDAPNRTISYFKQTGGTGAFLPVGSGPAFTNIPDPPPGKEYRLGLSVTCFGGCSFTLID